MLNARKKIQTGINNMKNEFGTQMMSFPNVTLNLHGDKYSVEFLIDQRKCDIFSVIVSALHELERHKEGSGIKVTNFTSFKDGNIQTLQVEFQENIGNLKSNRICKGTIYITGEYVSDRANFRFILEKSLDISEIDITAFLSSYKEANKPNQFV